MHKISRSNILRATPSAAGPLATGDQLAGRAATQFIDEEDLVSKNYNWVIVDWLLDWLMDWIGLDWTGLDWIVLDWLLDWLMLFDWWFIDVRLIVFAENVFFVSRLCSTESPVLCLLKRSPQSKKYRAERPPFFFEFWSKSEYPYSAQNA